MAVIGSLNINIAAGISQLPKQFAKAGKEASAFASKVGGAFGNVGGFAVGAIGSIAKVGAAFVSLGAGAAVGGLALLTKNSMDSIDTNAKVADGLGVTTESLTGLQHAANLAGVDNEAFNKSLNMMQKNLGNAAIAGGPVDHALKRIGLNASTLTGMSADKSFAAIADGISKITNPAEQAAVATKIFGKQGQALLATLKLGSSGLSEAAAEAAALGLTFSRIDAAKVEQANDDVSRLGGAFQGIGNTLAIGFAPMISAVATGFTDLVKFARETFSGIGDSFAPITEGVVTLFDMAFGVAKSAVTAMLPYFQMIPEIFQTIFPVVLQFGSVIASVFTAAWSIVSTIFSAIGSFISSTFGFVAGTAQTSFSDIASFITDAMIIAEFGITNFRDVAELAVSYVGLKFLEFANDIIHFFTSTIPTAVMWFADNFSNIVFTAIDYTLTAFVNLGKNVRALWQAVLDFFSTGQFNVNFTPLLEGAKSAISKMPEFVDREKGPLEQAMSDNVDALGNKLSTGLADFMANKKLDLGDITASLTGPSDLMAGITAPTLPDLTGENGITADAKKNKGKDKLTSGAELAGSKEAFSTILRGVFGGNDPNKKIADNTKALVKGQSEQNRLVARQIQLAEDEETVDF